MMSWLTRHVQTLVGSLGRLSQQPLASSLTVVVMAIALALPASLNVLVNNAQAISGSWRGVLDISVYLKNSIDGVAANELMDKLKRHKDIKQVRLIKAEDALKEFREYSGFGEALEALRDNPLPNTLVVTPAPQLATPAGLDALSEELRKFPEVDVVQLDTAWVQRYLAILEAVRRIVTMIGLLLALGAVVIVGNTIRLDIQNRRDEIEITKLVGGSDAFVRRPFLYSGFWYGLCGGLLAWVLVTVAVVLLSGPVRHIASLYGSQFELSGLGLLGGLGLLVSGAVLGWLGSFVAATRHLRAVEPK